MRQLVVLGVIVGLLLTVGCMVFAGRVKGDENPWGVGEKLNFNSVEYINQDEPCWLRVGEYHPVYAKFIPDLKEYFDAKKIAPGGATINIFLDGSQLHREVERSVVWRDDIDYTLDLPYPAEYDTKFTWYFVQFPAGYFEPGIHEIIIMAYANNPNSYIHEIYGPAPVVFEIELHVAE